MKYSFNIEKSIPCLGLFPKADGSWRTFKVNLSFETTCLDMIYSMSRKIFYGERLLNLKPAAKSIIDFISFLVYFLIQEK